MSTIYELQYDSRVIKLNKIYEIW